MACVYLALMAFALVNATPVPHGKHVHWRDLKDDRWEEPQGRFFTVTKSSEINALQDELQPGDAMIMAPGDWDSSRIDITASGTDEPGYKIYLIPEIYGETRFVGSTRMYLHGQYIEVRGMWLHGEAPDLIQTAIQFEKTTAHCRITNSAITFYNREEGDEPGKTVWIRIWGEYNTLDWNHFEGKETWGEMIQVRTEVDPPPTTPDTFGHYFAHNYFGPRPVSKSGDEGEGIQLGLYSSENMDYECIVEFNLFDNYDGEIECVSVKSSNNTVRYNTFRDSACTITLRHTNNTVVEENYFFCGGKEDCGGLRVMGQRHVILNNYIEESRSTWDNIGGIVLYAGNSEDPYRKLVKDVRLERNIMPNCNRCLIAGAIATAGGDQFPENVQYIENVLVARTEEDYAYKEEQQSNPNFVDNIAFGGIIENEGAYDGLVRQDPEFEYNEEFEIQVPTSVDFEFKMTYPPLKREDVGTTWYSES